MTALKCSPFPDTANIGQSIKETYAPFARDDWVIIPRVNSALTIPDNLGELDPLRQLFNEISFSYAEIYRALGLPEGASLSPVEHPMYARRLSGDDPLGVIIVLFIFGIPVARDIVDNILGAPIVHLLDRTGLARVTRSRIQSSIRIQPHEEFYFVVDPPFSRGKPDDVLGIGPSGKKLSSLTIRREVQSALDIGCGCGLQALLTSRHAEKVVAIDINRRAVEFTKFNAALNGVTNLDVRLGDLFQPVANERFDLIVCNPPFVISPEESVLYRDSGLPVNGIVRKVLTELPQHLAEDGFGHLTCHWAHRDQVEWWGPVSDLITQGGCDTWMARQTTDRPADYAIRWNRRLLSENPRRYRKTLEHWYDWYREVGITAITSAFVSFHRQADRRPWIHRESISNNPFGRGSEQLLRIFSAQAYLSRLSDEEDLLKEKFSLASGTEIAEQSISQSGELTLLASEIQCKPGIGARVKLDADMTRVVKSLDSQQGLREVLSTTAASHGVQLSALTRIALPITRKLYGLGMLRRTVSKTTNQSPPPVPGLDPISEDPN